MIVNLQALSRLQLIRVCIAKVEIAKKLFLNDIEQGNEAYVYNELSQHNLPINYWFYDPILIWV